MTRERKQGFYADLDGSNFSRAPEEQQLEVEKRLREQIQNALKRMQELGIDLFETPRSEFSYSDLDHPLTELRKEVNALRKFFSRLHWQISNQAYQDGQNSVYRSHR